MEREDNSTTLPGKHDTKKVNSDKQKIILNDYLHNLHKKFRIEYPSVNISLSQFCKLRPSNVILSRFAFRHTCLCTYHQNFAPKLNSLQNQGLQVSNNPDMFLKTFDEKCTSSKYHRKSVG